MTAAAAPVTVRNGRFAGVGPLGVALGVVAIALVAVVALALVQSIDAERISRYGARFLWGVVTTVELVALSLAIGALISIPVAAGRLSRNRIFSAVAYGYSYFFRGTPLLAQLFLIYYGAGEFAPFLKSAGLWWFFREAFYCALLSFALNTAAYQAEILSGSIRNMPKGQWEGAYALGLHDLSTLWNVILPQALVTALRPYGNEVVLMIKASAVASIVTVLDLMGQTRFIFSKTYDLSVYLWAALFYLIMVWALSRAVALIEVRITRHFRKR
jgi:polar amino acid transport system permease protein